MPDDAETTATQPPGHEFPPEAPAPRPRARERGRMRRRLRRQRQMREALLLDLGALVFELHRHRRREPELLQAKAAELSAVDGEVRALMDALDADAGELELVVAGIAGSCASCGTLLSIDARYCPACGHAAVPALEQAKGFEPDRAEASAGEVEGRPAAAEDHTGESRADEAAPAEPEPAPLVPELPSLAEQNRQRAAEIAAEAAKAGQQAVRRIGERARRRRSGRR